jgi:co-chaperonin GroES (HSP10)
VQVEDTSDVTIGGVVLPETAKERPLLGTVVSMGPGKYDKDSPEQRKAMVVRAHGHLASSANNTSLRLLVKSCVKESSCDQ